METDLCNEDDAVLEAALRIRFDDHGAATDAGDGPAQAEAHVAIMVIIGEQRRRTDAWIDQKRTACDAQH